MWKWLGKKIALFLIGAAEGVSLVVKGYCYGVGIWWALRWLGSPF